MKRCPTCHRTYADETLSYCLADGSLLSAPYADPQATQRISQLPAAHLPPTEILRPEQTPSQPTQRKNRWPYVIIIALPLIAVAAFVLFKSLRKESPQAEPPKIAVQTSPSAAATPKNEQAVQREQAANNQNQNLNNNSEPGNSSQPAIPKIYGTSYDVARELLIREGWQPDKKHMSHENSAGVQSGNGPIFWKRGYWELDSCSGTGLAHCLFEFFDHTERVLVVVTEGEEAEDGEYHATVSRVFFKSK